MNDNKVRRAPHEIFDKTMATGAEAVRDVEESFTSALQNVCDLNVRLIDMAWANTKANFDFAREVAAAKGPSDLIEACTAHAAKQFDLLTKQASELKTLGQQFRQQTTKRLSPGWLLCPGLGWLALMF